MIKKQIYSTGLQYYLNHLTIVSTMLPEDKQLTPVEMKTLAAFMYVYNGVFDKYHVTFETRKRVRDLLQMSSASMSMYIKKLNELQYLQRIEGSNNYNILESLIPEENMEKYMIILHKIVMPDEKSS